MNKMLIDEATVKLALETLEHLQPTALTSFYTIGDRDKVITALQEALTEQPAQRKPLTDEEITAIEEGIWKPEFFDDTERQANREFARAIEAAHGIKENK